MKLLSIGFVLAALAMNLAGQESTGKIQFEVASVRPSAPDDGRPRGINESSGGPGTSNPGRFRATNMSLSGLLMRAYNVKPYQVSGPAWLNTTHFDGRSDRRGDSGSPCRSPLRQRIGRQRSRQRLCCRTGPHGPGAALPIRRTSPCRYRATFAITGRAAALPSQAPLAQWNDARHF